MTEAAPVGSGKELAALYPIGEVVEIAGRRVEVPKCGARLCLQIMQRVGVAAALMELEGADEVIYLDEHADEANDLCAFAFGQSPEWAAQFDAVEKIELAGAWWKVNGFFVARQLQARARAAEIAASYGAGLTPSNTSAKEDIPMPTITPSKPSKRGSTSSTALNSAPVAPR